MRTTFLNTLARRQWTRSSLTTWAGSRQEATLFQPFRAVTTESGWLAGQGQIDSVSSTPALFNGLSALNGHNVSSTLNLLSDNALGANYEHCYSTSGSSTQLKVNGWLWQTTENTEIAVAAQNKLFSCMVRNLNDAASSADERIYVLASFLLTYDPQTSILWEEFGTPSGFNVMPESQLVVLDPVVGQPELNQRTPARRRSLRTRVSAVLHRRQLRWAMRHRCQFK